MPLCIALLCYFYIALSLKRFFTKKFPAGKNSQRGVGRERRDERREHSRLGLLVEDFHNEADEPPNNQEQGGVPDKRQPGVDVLEYACYPTNRGSAPMGETREPGVPRKYQAVKPGEELRKPVCSNLDYHVGKSQIFEHDCQFGNEVLQYLLH